MQEAGHRIDVSILYLICESFVILARQHAKLRIHVVLFLKRIPTDVVCSVILFLLDLSSLNKDILFLSLFFNAYDCTLHYLECCPLYRYSSHSRTFRHIPIRCSFPNCPLFSEVSFCLSQLCNDSKYFVADL